MSSLLFIAILSIFNLLILLLFIQNINAPIGIENDTNHGEYGLAAVAEADSNWTVNNWKLNCPVVQFIPIEVNPNSVKIAHNTFFFSIGVRMQTIKVYSEKMRKKIVNSKIM